MKKRDFDEEAMRTSRLGLVAGIIVFLGLGCFLLLSGVSDFPNVFARRFGAFHRAVDGISDSVGVLAGLGALVVGVKCILLLFRKRELKQWSRQQAEPQRPPPILPREFTYQLSLGFLLKAMRRQFLIEFSGASLVFGMTAMASTAVLVSPEGQGNIAAIVLLAVCLAFDLQILLVYTLGKKRTRQFAGQQITLRLEPETITFQSAEATSTIKWVAMDRVRRFPDGILVKFRHRSDYFALPLEALGEEAILFIENKMNQNKTGKTQVT